MPPQNGTYRLYTESRDVRLHVGVSPESVSAVNEGGVPVVAGPESSEVNIELHALGEDKYHISLMYHGKMALGYGDDESGDKINVIATPQNGHTQWIIKQENGPEKYQICTPQSELHWSIIPGTSPSSPIVLSPTNSGDLPKQEWTLEFISDNEP